jgi:hypothetical protein
MSTARDDHGEPESSTVAGEPSTRTSGSRRRLLETAVGGFALAASGLVVPAWLGEAAAAERPLDRVQRRTEQRNREQGNNDRGDKKDKDKGGDGGDDKDKGGDGGDLDSGLFRDTALTIKNFRRDPQATASVTFFFAVKNGLDSYGNWIPDVSVDLPPDASFRYAKHHFRVGALIAFRPSFDLPPAFVDVRNKSFDFPQGAIYYGAGLDPASGKLGTALLPETGFNDAAADGTPYKKNVLYRNEVIVIDDHLQEFTHVREIQLELARGHDSTEFIEFQLGALIFEYCPGC